MVEKKDINSSNMIHLQIVVHEGGPSHSVGCERRAGRSKLPVVVIVSQSCRCHLLISWFTIQRQIASSVMPSNFSVVLLYCSRVQYFYMFICIFKGSLEWLELWLFPFIIICRKNTFQRSPDIGSHSRTKFKFPNFELTISTYCTSNLASTKKEGQKKKKSVLTLTNSENLTSHNRAKFTSGAYLLVIVVVCKAQSGEERSLLIKPH
jgi:hypothetical protein